jgi:hypothetical protein
MKYITILFLIVGCCYGQDHQDSLAHSIYQTPEYLEALEVLKQIRAQEIYENNLIRMQQEQERWDRINRRLDARQFETQLNRIPADDAQTFIVVYSVAAIALLVIMGMLMQ